MRSNTTPARGSMIVLDEYYDTVCEYTYDAVDLLAYQEVNGKREQLARGTNIPKIILTQETTQRLSQIQPIISDTVDRYIADWIQNGTSDESWNATWASWSLLVWMSWFRFTRMLWTAGFDRLLCFSAEHRNRPWRFLLC